MSNHDQSDKRNPYYILNVEIGENDPETLKKAYQLTLQWNHPDKEYDYTKKPGRAAFCQKIQEAYKLVSDPQWREEFLKNYTPPPPKESGGIYDRRGHVITTDSLSGDGLHYEA